MTLKSIFVHCSWRSQLTWFISDRAVMFSLVIWWWIAAFNTNVYDIMKDTQLCGKKPLWDVSTQIKWAFRRFGNNFDLLQYPHCNNTSWSHSVLMDQLGYFGHFRKYCCHCALWSCGWYAQHLISCICYLIAETLLYFWLGCVLTRVIQVLLSVEQSITNCKSVTLTNTRVANL